MNYLSGIKILEEAQSSINGKLVVQKDLAWGVHILGGGLTQSGGVAEKVWRTALREAHKLQKTNHLPEQAGKSLILGLGGGSIAKIIRELWPKTIIDGVEIDPMMIDLGKKHMNLTEWDVNIFREDAKEFVDKALREKKKYDLICVDMYVQQDVPAQFTTKIFAQKIKKLMNQDAIAIFNRLYFDEKRKQAEKFKEMLDDLFEDVDTVYPEANVMYLAKKSS